MKNLKLFSVAMLAMAITLASCSGSDGEQGIQGKQGEPGPQGDSIKGDPGDPGDPGADGISCWDLNGNGVGDITVDANNEDLNLDGVVDALDCQGAPGQNGQDGNANVERWRTLLAGFTGSELIIPLETPPGTVNDYAYFFYLETANGNLFPVPGPIANTVYTSLYIDAASHEVNVLFWNSADNSAFIVPDGLFVYFHVIAVESPILGNKGTQESVLNELKAAGVDTNDYHAVAAYFGLE